MLPVTGQSQTASTATSTRGASLAVEDPLDVSDETADVVVMLIVRVVDARLAKLVFDHRDALAMVLAQQALEQRRLARAEKAGKDGNGDTVIAGGVSHGKAPYCNARTRR